jgi:hypothetical protein
MQSRSLVLAGLSLVVGVKSFGRPVTLVWTAKPNAAGPLTSSTQLQMAPPPDAPAGSFFNPVPSNDNDAEKKKKKKKQQVPSPPLPPIVPEATTTGNSSSDDNKDDLDEKLTQLLRQRQKPPRASSPSTINGVPTEKASGR